MSKLICASFDCNNEFEKTSNNKKFCSRKCAVKKPPKFKICKNCNKEFRVNEQWKYNCSKKCSIEYKAKWLKKYNQENKEKRREYYQKNKEKIIKRSINWRDKNWEKIKEKVLETQRKYRAENIEKVRKWNRENRKKLSQNPVKKLEYAMRCRLGAAIRDTGFTKRSRTYKYVGCSWDKLKAHLENQFKPGMTWENHGEWHIDHIYPLSWCDTEEELFIYSHYSNLQPLWEEENVKKSDNYIG